MNIWLKLLISILPTVVVAGGMSLWKKLREYLYTKDVIPFLIIAIILFGVISFVYYCPMSVENAPGGANVNHLSIANKIEKIDFVTQLNHPEIASQLLHGLVLVLLLLGFYFWFRSNQKRFEVRVTQEKNTERRSVENTKNAEINRLQQDIEDEKQRVGNEAYAIWAENHAGASIAEGLGGLKGFCRHLIDIMKHRTLDGQPNGASALTITGIKLATNTPLLFSLQQETAHYNCYTPNVSPPADHWVRFFCTGFRSALRGLKDELKHFEWIYLYPNILRSQLGWFPFQELEEYEKWANDHEVFLNRVEEDLPEPCKESMWHRETSMISLVTAIIDFKNKKDGTSDSKVIVGLANLVDSETSLSDQSEAERLQVENLNKLNDLDKFKGIDKFLRHKKANLQAEKFPWFHSSSKGIVDFFKQYHDSLGYRDIELMQAIEKFLTQAGRKNLDIIFHQDYSSKKHAHLGDLPEGLKPQSRSYVPIKTKRRT